MSKYYEDDHSSCYIHKFRVEDNPKIEMIRITAVNTNCSSMYDMDFEYNYFLDYHNRELLIRYLSVQGYYHGDLYEAIKDKYGEYMEKGMLAYDMKENDISFIEDLYFRQPEGGRYNGFTKFGSMEKFKDQCPEFHKEDDISDMD